MASTVATDRTPATFEEIWATLDRTAKLQEEQALAWEKREKERLEREREREARARKHEEERLEREEREKEHARKREEEREKERLEREEREKEHEKKREAERLEREEREKEHARKREEEREKERLEREEREKEHEKKREAERQEWEKRKADWEHLREMVAENSRVADAYNAKAEALYRRFGDVIEHLVAPGMVDSFDDLGISLEIKRPHKRKIKEDDQTIAEVDLTLENDETVVIVETKARVRLDDVRDHVSRMEKLRGYYDRQGDSRKLMGAIAGAVFGLSERITTRKAGFFTVVQRGDTMMIDVPDDFKPREW